MSIFHDIPTYLPKNRTFFMDVPKWYSKCFFTVTFQIRITESQKLGNVGDIIYGWLLKRSREKRKRQCITITY